eukprot:COSAG02_NODE_9809_length_2103_cov_1.778942_1_plen_184_part_00
MDSSCGLNCWCAFASARRTVAARFRYTAYLFRSSCHIGQGGLEVEDVYFACVKHGITMSQGPNFYWETDPAKPNDKHLRLAFTSSTQAQLAEVCHCNAIASSTAQTPSHLSFNLSMQPASSNRGVKMMLLAMCGTGDAQARYCVQRSRSGAIEHGSSSGTCITITCAPSGCVVVACWSGEALD